MRSGAEDSGEESAAEQSSIHAEGERSEPGAFTKWEVERRILVKNPQRNGQVYTRRANVVSSERLQND